MVKTTTEISGPRLAAFCRELFAETLAGDRDLADRLVRDFAGHVTVIRVRRERLARPLHGKAEVKPAAAREQPAPVGQPLPAADEPAATTQPAAALAEPSSAADAPGEKPFDPYAFSVIALMSKKGRAALAKRLAEIQQMSQLRALADAQGLTIDSVTIAATGEAIDDLRLAIMKAAEQRIADRRAAAS